MKLKVPCRLFIAVIILISLNGCIKPYETEVEQGDQRLVVEGYISSTDGPYKVVLSYSGNYAPGIDGISEFISGAYLCISDDVGNCSELFETSPGKYSTWNSSFRGEAGKSYTLEIILPNGNRYLSRPEKMLTSPQISRIYSEYEPGSELKKEGFYVYVDTEDPTGEVNFYKWETVSWFYYSFDPCWNRIPDFNPFNIESDKNINGNQVARKLVKIVPYNSRLPYVVTAYQFALSENAYNFLKNLNDQINLSGSIFDPPPTFIRGNIFNQDKPAEIVLGYFYAAGSTEIEIAVDRSIPEDAPDHYAEILNPPIYCGDPCDYLCVAFTGGKCGFPPCPPECNDLPNVTYKPPASWPMAETLCDE